MRLDILKEFLKMEHNIPPEDVEDICKSVFKFVKSKIDDENFDEIRLKHLGVFTIYQGTAKAQINKKKKKLKNGKITKEMFENYKKLITDKILKK